MFIAMHFDQHHCVVPPQLHCDVPRSFQLGPPSRGIKCVLSTPRFILNVPATCCALVDLVVLLVQVLDHILGVMGVQDDLHTGN